MIGIIVGVLCLISGIAIGGFMAMVAYGTMFGDVKRIEGKILGAIVCGFIFLSLVFMSAGPLFAVLTD